MVSAPSSLLWELTKKNHAFLYTSVNHETFSKEKGNAANRHSYKYSGIANYGSTVDVTEQDGAAAIAVSSKAGKLKSVPVKKNTRRTIHAAGAVAGTKRPDLKHAAKAKAAAIAKALRKRKATASN